MKRLPFSEAENEIIAECALAGITPHEIARRLRDRGYNRSHNVVSGSRSYNRSRHAFLTQVPDEPEAPPAAAPSVYPKYTRMVLPISTTWTQHFNEPVRVPVSLRAMSWDLPA